MHHAARELPLHPEARRTSGTIPPRPIHSSIVQAPRIIAGRTPLGAPDGLVVGNATWIAAARQRGNRARSGLLSARASVVATAAPLGGASLCACRDSVRHAMESHRTMRTASTGPSAMPNTAARADTAPLRNAITMSGRRLLGAGIGRRRWRGYRRRYAARPTSQALSRKFARQALQSHANGNASPGATVAGSMGRRHTQREQPRSEFGDR